MVRERGPSCCREEQPGCREAAEGSCTEGEAKLSVQVTDARPNEHNVNELLKPVPYIRKWLTHSRAACCDLLLTALLSKRKLTTPSQFGCMCMIHNTGICTSLHRTQQLQQSSEKIVAVAFRLQMADLFVI